MKKRFAEVVQPDGVLKSFIEDIESELLGYFQMTDEAKMLCCEVQRWASIRYKVIYDSNASKNDVWDDDEVWEWDDLSETEKEIVERAFGKAVDVSPLPPADVLFAGRIAYVEERLLIAQNALFRLLQEQGRQESEKRIGSIVHDVFLLRQYHTPEEDLWYDAHARLDMSIADIARQARQTERYSSSAQPTMEKRVERAIAAVRAKRAKMDSNFG